MELTCLFTPIWLEKDFTAGFHLVTCNIVAVAGVCVCCVGHLSAVFILNLFIAMLFYNE